MRLSCSHGEINVGYTKPEANHQTLIDKAGQGFTDSGNSMLIFVCLNLFTEATSDISVHFHPAQSMQCHTSEGKSAKNHNLMT